MRAKAPAEDLYIVLGMAPVLSLFLLLDLFLNEREAPFHLRNHPEFLLLDSFERLHA